MRFAKKAFIPVLSPVREIDFLPHSEIHFVHVFDPFNYSSVMSDFPFVYPIEIELKAVELSVKDLLIRIAQGVLPKNFTGKVVQKFLRTICE